MYMAGLDIGQHGDLHGLLQSLNALGTESSLSLVRDEDGIWNRIALARKIHIKVEASRFISLYHTNEKIADWETDITPTDSLCDILDSEANFKRYHRVLAKCSGVRTLDVDVSGRTYSETKSLIDIWGRSLFLTPHVGIAYISVFIHK